MPGIIVWNRKNIIIAVVGAVVIIVCILFAIPFIDVSYEAIESYEDVKYEKETYTKEEPYTVIEDCEREEIIFDDDPISVPEGIAVKFSIGKEITRLTGHYTLPEPGAFYLYSAAGKIIHEQLGMQGNVDITLGAGEYKAVLRERVSWEDRVYLFLKLNWTEQCEVIKYREVTGYRDIPVTEEKQRTVTLHKKVSFWEMIFNDRY